MMPLSAGVLLVRSESDLDAAFRPGAVAAGDEPGERSWDQFGRTFLNSRRLDALKLWVALQRHGVAGLGALYDHLCALAGALYREVCARPDFEPLHEPDCSLLVFRYVGRGPRRDGPALDALNRRLWRESLRRGHAFLSAPVLDGHAGLLAAITNPFLSGDDIARLLDGLSELGAALAGDGQGGEAT
jgi:L-2,4-diaminobutyrate decarboxylase